MFDPDLKYTSMDNQGFIFDGNSAMNSSGGCLFDCLKNGDIESFNSKLKEAGLEFAQNKTFLNLYGKFYGKNEDYTLMQYAAKMGLEDIILALLRLGVDPNISDKKTKAYPVLLAAEYGHHHVLEIFKYCKATNRPRWKSKRQSSKLSLALDRNEMEMSDVFLRHTVDFKVVKPDSIETVLHTIFKRPVLSEKLVECKRSEKLQSEKSKDEKRQERKALLDLDKNYLKCANVVLEDEFMYRIDIINAKDRLGNTALHYATSNNWPQHIIEKLLHVGANLAALNNKNVMPLTSISKDAIEDYMDDHCITVDDLDDDTDEGDEEAGCNDDDDNDMLDEYDPSFLSNTAELPIHFNYRFLAPGFDHQERIEKNMNIAKDRPLTLEMEVLYHIAQSKNHYKLVTHPVIKSYVWIKWKLISRLFHRNLRLRCFYVFVLTWFILTKFAGVLWRHRECSTKAVFFDGVCENKSKPLEDIMHRNDSHTLCKDTEFYFNFKQGYHHECTHSSPVYILYVFVSIVLSLSTFGAFKDDFIRKWYDHEGFCTMNRKMILLLVACWLDFWTFVLLGLVIWKSEIILWFVITVILILTLQRETHQMRFMKLEYLKEPGKWFDMLHFTLVIIILYVPNQYLLDPLTFSSPKTLNLLCNSANITTIEQWNDGNCSIKRCMAAFTIVFAWSRLLVTIVKHPYLQKLNVYLQMLSKVTHSFLKFLGWYSFFIGSFILGFYVMLHNDVGNSNVSLKGKYEGAFEEFDHPNEAVMKTLAMYIGELDFSAMPIGIKYGRKHGNISVSMIQLFVLFFMFFIVIVLGNLLNGLAVSDTNEILKKASILHQISLINVLTYGERLTLGNVQQFKYVGQKLPKMKRFLDKTFISAISSLLLLSSYIDFIPERFPQLEVTIPLIVEEDFDESSKDNSTSSSTNKLYQKLSTLLNYILRSVPFCDEELNYGCNEFLDEARDILKNKRLCKIAQRKKADNKRKKLDQLKLLIRTELQSIQKLRDQNC